MDVRASTKGYSRAQVLQAFATLCTNPTSMLKLWGGVRVGIK